MRKNAILLLLIIVLTGMLTGCADEKNTVGLIDSKKALDDSGYGEQLKKLQEEMMKFETALADRREAFKKEFSQKEQQANESIRAALQSRMQSKGESLEKEVQERNKDFIAAKEQEMYAYIASVEKETNDKLSAIKSQMQKSDIKEEEFKSLENQMDDIKTEATNKIKSKDAELKKQVQDKLAPEYEALQSQMRSYSETVQQQLYDEQARELKAYAEKVLGPDQKQQNELREKFDNMLREADARVKEAVEAVAKEKGLEIVFTDAVNKEGTVNITGDVVKYIKEKYPVKQEDKKTNEAATADTTSKPADTDKKAESTAPAATENKPAQEEKKVQAPVKTETISIPSETGKKSVISIPATTDNANKPAETGKTFGAPITPSATDKAAN